MTNAGSQQPMEYQRSKSDMQPKEIEGNIIIIFIKYCEEDGFRTVST